MPSSLFDAVAAFVISSARRGRSLFQDWSAIFFIELLAWLGSINDQGWFARMSARSSLAIGLDAKIVGSNTHERPFLIAMFILIYVSYGALGRDVFFNHLNSADAAAEDPIGLVLPFIRVGACFAAVSVIVMSAGLTWGLSKVPLLFAPFCVLALLSPLWADQMKETFRNAVVLTAVWIAMPMIIHRLGMAQTVRASLHLIAVVVIASALLAILVPSVGRHSGQEFIQSVHIGRWRGIFGHKNGLGPWAAYGSVFLFSYSWLCSGPRLYWWAARLSALACLVFSGSATGLVLAIVLAFLSVFMIMLRRQRLSIVVGSALLALFGMAVAAYLLQDFIFDALGRDGSLSGRTEIWALASDYFWLHPWFGNGYQSLGGPDFLMREKMVFQQPIPGPENGYLTLLLDLGLVGFAFFFVPFILAIRNGFEWLKHVRIEDRAGIEFFLLVMLSTPFVAITESNALVSTGFDGVIAFAGFFTLMTTPKSPGSALRGEFRMAKYRM